MGAGSDASSYSENIIQSGIKSSMNVQKQKCYNMQTTCDFRESLEFMVDFSIAYRISQVQSLVFPDKRVWIGNGKGSFLRLWRVTAHHSRKY